MVKKVILGVLFLGLVGALVIGAVNRTAAKSADLGNAEQRGAGWARAQESGALLATNVQSQGGGQGGGRNSSQQFAAGTADGAALAQKSRGRNSTAEQIGSAGQTQGYQGGRGNGAGGQQSTTEQIGSAGQTQGYQGGRGNSAGGQQSTGPIAETEDHEWVTLTGAVVSADDIQMVVQTESGEIVIADRPWSYALSAGFSAHPGDQVTMEGFYENETFEAGRLTNGAQVVSIREDSGRPLWAGGGRMGGSATSGRGNQ